MSLIGLTRTTISCATLIVAALAIASLSAPTRAADTIFTPGEPIVTGFSGVQPPEGPMPDGADPLDYTFIDPFGNSMVIQKLEPGDPPSGQLIDAAPVFAATAADVGQVFGIALDNAPELTGADAPNIYLAATSAYGLNLVVPDPDGNPMRSRTGDAGAGWAPGQWGGAGGEEGYPGSIWKVDGTTGEVTLFSTIATNTGAGLGDIVYDPSTAQFFVSDLDTGLIYRLDSNGAILDTFDHGVDALTTAGLDPVEDDASAVDVTDPSFDTEDPSTWGMTQPERRVHGLGLFGSRLYYSVTSEIWSVGIKADGSFGVPRWETDIADLPEGTDITHIVFDPQGRMILAERGQQVGNYDYSVFATPGAASVLRLKREFPDDLTTPGIWAPVPDSYAIGMAEGGANGAGGVTLGPDYDEESGAFDGACNAYIWATGDALRDNADLDPPLDPPAQVSGLQGNERMLRRPWNDPPRLSFFADYDGNTNDDQAANLGHVGGVAMWQDCSGTEPVIDVPDDLPPPDYVPPPDYNLSLDKWSSPFECFDGGASWWCSYTIRVENTASLPYWGPVVVEDYLPAANPGASMHFWPTPPWTCSPTGATSYQCARGPVLLYPGDAVVLHETVELPKAMVAYCHLANVAGLDWGVFGHDGDPSDDFGVGVTHINAPGCAAPAGSADLALSKTTFPTTCFDFGIEWACNYAVYVQNVGPGNFTGPITVKDTLGVNAPATVLGPWICGQVGPVLTCNIAAPPVNAPPGWNSAFLVTAHVKKNVGPPLCDLDNKANISAPAAPSLMNAIGGNDFDQATTHIPDPACFGPTLHPDLEMQKAAMGCAPFVYMAVNGYLCHWQMTLTNVGPDPYNGPLSWIDTSAGATLDSLTLTYPFCTGPASHVTCVVPGSVTLNPGVPAVVPFVTFYPDGPSVCSATNNLSIEQPNPGGALNPGGNDSSSVGQALPNPACAAPGAPKLNIQKTAKGCASDPSGPDWLCVFDIDVFNYGGGAQPGPIVVRDVSNKPTTFSTPACVPAGPPNQYDCTRAAVLNSGAVWHFQATSHVDPNGVTLADCNVDDTVLITTPFAPDPGHFAQANQKVPQLFINVGPGPVAVYCDPPSLKLAKAAGQTIKSGDGYDSTFTIKATSTGPDPYHGTVELDEVLPDGTTYVKSSWPCVPTTGNDVHCSSPYKDLNVGQFTSMTITIHIPKDVAVAARCDVVNTVNAAISAEVLHSDVGVQYTASAAAKLPASVCTAPIECPVNQVKPGGGCCPDGNVWDGKQCAPPPKVCPRDSVAVDGACECKDGTHGTPGKCKPDVIVTICPDDSKLIDGACECRDGTHGTPGRCVLDTPLCPDDSHFDKRVSDCVCDPPLVGEPGRCHVDIGKCPKDSRLVDGECKCLPGTVGKPGKCEPVTPLCPKDSRMVDGECQCLPGTEGKPGRCQVVAPACPDDSHFDKRSNACVCNAPLTGKPGTCKTPAPACPKDSQLIDGECQCLPGTEGRPGRCALIAPTCPDDSHLNRRSNTCVCNAPLIGEPGSCQPPVRACPADSQAVDGECQCLPGTKGRPGKCQPDAPACPGDSHLDKRTNACVCSAPLVGEPGACTPCPDDSHFDRRTGICVCNAPLTGEPGKCSAVILLR